MIGKNCELIVEYVDWLKWYKWIFYKFDILNIYFFDNYGGVKLVIVLEYYWGYV